MLDEAGYFRTPSEKMYGILRQFMHTMIISIEVEILIEFAAVAIGLKLFFEKFFR